MSHEAPSSCDWNWLEANLLSFLVRVRVRVRVRVSVRVWLDANLLSFLRGGGLGLSVGFGPGLH